VCIQNKVGEDKFFTFEELDEQIEISVGPVVATRIDSSDLSRFVTSKSPTFSSAKGISPTALESESIMTVLASSTGEARSDASDGNVTASTDIANGSCTPALSINSIYLDVSQDFLEKIPAEDRIIAHMVLVHNMGFSLDALSDMVARGIRRKDLYAYSMAYVQCEWKRYVAGTKEIAGAGLTASTASCSAGVDHGGAENFRESEFDGQTIRSEKIIPPQLKGVLPAILQASNEVKRDIMQTAETIKEKLERFKVRMLNEMNLGVTVSILDSVIESIRADCAGSMDYYGFVNHILERCFPVAVAQQQQQQQPQPQQGLHTHDGYPIPDGTSSTNSDQLTTAKNARHVLNLRIPDKRLQATVSVPAELTFDQLFAVMVSTANYHKREHDEVIMFVVANGWSIEVVANTVLSSAWECNVNDIPPNSLIELRKHRISSVSGKFALSSIASSDCFNMSLQHKIRTLNTVYAGYRKIRGDGNCYYRSVIYGLIEQLITRDCRVGFQGLYNIFSNLACPVGETADAKCLVSARFQEAYGEFCSREPLLHID
jgi:hypothetical protein